MLSRVRNDLLTFLEERADPGSAAELSVKKQTEAQNTSENTEEMFPMRKGLGFKRWRKKYRNPPSVNGIARRNPLSRTLGPSPVKRTNIV